MSQRPEAVLFDFDCTLADSSAGVVECVRFPMDKLELPMAPGDAIRGTIGLSLAETFRRLVDARHWVCAEEFVRLFMQRADQVMADRTVLFATVPETLGELISQGLALGIVSTKYRYRISAILRREGLADSFDVIIGGEDVVNHKPDPGGLLLAVASLARHPSEVVYVGDCVTDAETAEGAEIAWSLARAHWGEGQTTGAATAGRHLAFESNPELNRIHARGPADHHSAGPRAGATSRSSPATAARGGASRPAARACARRRRRRRP